LTALLLLSHRVTNLQLDQAAFIAAPRIYLSRDGNVMSGACPEYVPDFTAATRPVAVRPGGYAVSLIHQTSIGRVNLQRVLPGGEISGHHHSASWDYFIGRGGRGCVETITETGVFETYTLSVNSFLAIPPGITHRVRNLRSDEPFAFILIQTPLDDYDFVSDVPDTSPGESEP
jgi:mannose-6-phosphate isomerase-like protein (cupin superfamily)